jgi:hypothetical protein
MYNALDEGNDTDSGTEGTVATQTVPITQTTATTMGSTLGNTYGGGTIPAEISNAISQLAANKQSIMTQMASMSFKNAQPPKVAATFHVPPIQQLNIPTFAGQATPGYNAGTGFTGGNRGHRRGRGRGVSRGVGGRGNAPTPFANHVRNTQMAGGWGGRALPGIGYPPPVAGIQWTSDQAAEPTTFKHCEGVRQLECLFLVWV